MAMASIDHLQKIQALLESLAANGIEMESHRYDLTAFGSFAMVLAKSHTKARFTWDGRESVLTVEWQRVQNNTVVGEWQHDAFIQAATGDDALAEIGSNAEAMLQ
jgi:hypothetical protein